MSYHSLDKIVNFVKSSKRSPDFENIRSVLRRRVPSRPTQFEFILNSTIYNQVTGRPVPADGDGESWCPCVIETFTKLGYDFAPIGGWQLNALVFPKAEKIAKQSRSLNQGVLITDRASFEKYAWPDIKEHRLEPLERADDILPDGMKMIPYGVEGVLEAVLEIVGFENLCLLLYMDPELIKAIFEHIGSRLLQYYQHLVRFDSVGAVIANDDWGFKTQTMLPPDDLRRLVFPWYKKIVKTAHDAGVPVILHSCGNAEAIMDDIIDDIKFDGKHSYEDTIIPVEKAIDRWSDRIAVIGGIDVDFLTNHSPKEIYNRTKSLVDRSMQKGGIAIGSGNSIPDYIPVDHYCAMVEAVLEWQ